MAVISPEIVSISGLAATYNAASAGGDKISRTGKVFIHVKNGGASAVTATVVTPGTVVGQPIGDVAVSVPAGGERFIGPFTREHFSNTDRQVDITWSATTSVTFAALEV